LTNALFFSYEALAFLPVYIYLTNFLLLSYVLFTFLAKHTGLNNKKPRMNIDKGHTEKLASMDVTFRSAMPTTVREPVFQMAWTIEDFPRLLKEFAIGQAIEPEPRIFQLAGHTASLQVSVTEPEQQHFEVKIDN
jgi:hypothetical protein